jgi:Fe-S-cluster containining protein
MKPSKRDSHKLPDASDRRAIALEVTTVHTLVDVRVRELVRRHTTRLQCKPGCADCCVDELTVFEVEAERIRYHHPELLAHGEPHPPGACAFLAPDSRCRIYPQRPYVCRTQGLPLRWLQEDDAGNVQELRDICPINETSESITALAVSDCWTIGPIESKLATLQADVFGGELTRIALRDLFSPRSL